MLMLARPPSIFKNPPGQEPEVQPQPQPALETQPQHAPQPDPAPQPGVRQQPSERQSRRATRDPNHVKINGHSDLFYWWVVWLYGAICVVFTYLHGFKTQIGTKPIYIHQEPWLGISFTFLLCFVAIFTHARARGVYALVFLLIVALVVGGIHGTVGWGWFFRNFQHLSIHMNLAFFAVLSGVLFFAWAIMVSLAGRFAYMDVRPGQIFIKDMNLETAIASQGTTIKARAGDPFMHYMLGLRWLGFGTGDIEIDYNAQGSRHTHVLRNVWRASAKADRASRIFTMVVQQRQ
jgi:hypothetical protein